MSTKQTSEQIAAEKAEEQRQAAEKAAAEKAEEQRQAAEKAANEITDPKLVTRLQSLCKAYPDNAEFFVSTDGQIFLKKDKSAAMLHQRTLGEGALKNYKNE